MRGDRRILVTGATGFLGSRTVEQLAQSKDLHIVATGRTLNPEDHVKQDNVEYILGDLRDPDFALKLVQGVDAIVHAAALSSPWGTKDAFWEANVHPTQHLLDAAQQASVQRFVFVSTPSTYFQMKSQFDLKEDAVLPSPINQYAASKREAERRVQASHISHVILRPRALIGRGDTVILPRILRAHKEGKLRIMGSGENRVDLTPVSNVVDAIVLGLQAEGPALNQIYNISNGDPVQLWPTLNRVLSQLNLSEVSKSVPLPLVLLVARLMEWRAKFWNKGAEPTLTVYGVGTLAMDFTMDISKAQSLLGYTPRQTLTEAFDEFVRWHLQSKK